MSYPAEGGCFCGAVRYRIHAAPVDAMHCHCVNCQKASGAGMLTWLTVEETDFEWLAGEPKRYRYESDHYPQTVERWFCAECGSQLGWRCERDGTVDLTAGSLDDPDLAEPRFHHFLRSSPRWIHLDDGLPRHQAKASDDSP